MAFRLCLGIRVLLGSTYCFDCVLEIEYCSAVACRSRAYGAVSMTQLNGVHLLCSLEEAFEIKRPNLEAFFPSSLVFLDASADFIVVLGNYSTVWEVGSASIASRNQSADAR